MSIENDSRGGGAAAAPGVPPDMSARRAVVGPYSQERADRGLNPFQLLSEGRELLGWLDVGIPGTWGRVAGSSWEADPPGVAQTDAEMTISAALALRAELLIPRGK